MAEAQVQGLGDSRHFFQAHPPRLLHKAANPAGQGLRDAGHLLPDYAHLLFQGGVVYPEVQAPAAQGVGEVPGAVGCQDDGGNVLGLDRADFGDSDLELREDFQQECLELLVRPVHLVNEEHRGLLLLGQGGQEGALQEESLAEYLLLPLLGSVGVVLVQLYPEELLGVIPTRTGRW